MSASTRDLRRMLRRAERRMDRRLRDHARWRANDLGAYEWRMPAEHDAAQERDQARIYALLARLLAV